MGKASRWIVNFLLGKKDDKNRTETKKKKKKKRNVESFSADNLDISPENLVQSEPLKLKLRLSFGKQTGRQKRSKKKEVEEGTDQNYVKALARIPNVRSNAAATRIQAVYRAHLARKALQALKGLVKIQALVRGHLVRKQTAATVRSVQALMAIQVRARAQRMKTMKEELPLEGRRSSSKHFSNQNPPKKFHGEKMELNLEELRESLKSRSQYLNQSRVKRMQHELKTYYSKQKFFVSKRRHQPDEYSITSEPNSPQHYLYDQNEPQSHKIFPSFMANTESSRAKVRSQSEPKQRPEMNIRVKNKQIESARSSKEKNYDSYEV